MKPGYEIDLFIAIRNSKNKKLLAMIVCMPYKYNMLGKIVKFWSCNFLAVHKDLRNKRLAPIIIGEALRKSRSKGPSTALNTSFHSYPSPVVTCAPLNRFLKPEKCREIGYANV